MSNATLTRRAALLGAVSAPLAAASACVTSPASAADPRMDLLRDYLASLLADETVAVSAYRERVKISATLSELFPECRVRNLGQVAHDMERLEAADFIV